MCEASGGADKEEDYCCREDQGNTVGRFLQEQDQCPAALSGSSKLSAVCFLLWYSGLPWQLRR